MDILKSVGGWAKQLTEVGISGCNKHHGYLEWIE